MSFTILHIDSSPMGEKSVSKKLTQKVVETLTREHPDSRLISHDFGTSPLPHLDPLVLSAFFTPPAQQSQAQSDAIKVSDLMTDEVLAADVLVIGAPMWNLSIPSALKAWIDHIVRAGKTFKYGPSGAEGLIPKGKKVIVVSSRGGVYTEGPTKAYDFQETYLRTIFSFMGITDVSFVRAEGVSMGDEALAKALLEAETHIKAVV